MLLAVLPLLAALVTPSASTGNFDIPYLNYCAIPPSARCVAKLTVDNADCNAAHVTAANWTAPARPHAFTGTMQLAHVTALLRHHKRTPANLIPLENQFNPTGEY